MKIVEFEEKFGEIKDISSEVEKDKLTIRWKWPENVDIVYVLKTYEMQDFSLDLESLKNAKLYTMDEYREFNGYSESIKEITQYKYFVFPALQNDGDILLIKQNNGKNHIVVSTGKPEICYEINEVKSFKGLFSKEKNVEIVIKSEVSLDKDVLCYVKKKDSYPTNSKDGVRFDFICDIDAGVNVMPEIKINKNEYVKVFIKDIEKYGSSYKLKQL